MDLRTWLLNLTSLTSLPGPGLVGPEDEILLRYDRMREDEKAEVRRQIVRLLENALREDLRHGPWRIRFRNLVVLAERLELRSAKVPLLYLAQQPLPDDIMSWVLYGLAGLQTGSVMWDFWMGRWHTANSAHLPILSTALRLCDPERAVAYLPELLERTWGAPWLGDLLWSYATALPDGEAFAASMRSLRPRERDLCRRALRQMGATVEEAARWVPSPQVASEL